MTAALKVVPYIPPLVVARCSIFCFCPSTSPRFFSLAVSCLGHTDRLSFFLSLPLSFVDEDPFLVVGGSCL